MDIALLQDYLTTVTRRIDRAETSNELNRIITELSVNKSALTAMQNFEVEGDFLGAMADMFDEIQYDLDQHIQNAEATIDDMSDEDENVCQFGTYAQQVERTYNGGVL